MTKQNNFCDTTTNHKAQQINIQINKVIKVNKSEIIASKHKIQPRGT